MKVVLLAPTPPPAGGIASWTQRMLQTMLKNDWRVSVVDEKVIGCRTVFGSNSKINLFTETRRCLRIWQGLREELKDKEARVVQACIPAGTASMLREIISAYITKLYKRKFIVHFRCTLPNMIKTPTATRVFRKLIKLSDCVFLLNTASVDFLRTIDPTKRYELIPNFIEANAIVDRKNVSESLQRLTYIGGVIVEKGCAMIAELAKVFPEKEFRLVGKIGMDQASFPDNVRLLGEQSKEFVSNELNHTDAFLFLTRFPGEGFSNALAEAMAHSLPCIVSDWAANADMIENKGGVVLKQYNVEMAIDAVKKIEDYSVRKAMGEWNRQKILKFYSDKVVTDLYVDAYEKLVGKGQIQ